MESELSSYVGVLRARSTLQKERIRVRRMHGSASVGWPRHAYVMPAEHESNTLSLLKHCPRVDSFPPP